MSFQRLKSSPALELQSYDIDHFGESERYAGATSIPLSAGATAIMRARLNLPTLTLSLLKSCPRIVRGYQRFAGKNIGLPDVLSAKRNTVILWAFHPKDRDLATIEGCLK